MTTNCHVSLSSYQKDTEHSDCEEKRGTVGVKRSHELQGKGEGVEDCEISSQEKINDKSDSKNISDSLRNHQGVVLTFEHFLLPSSHTDITYQC